MHRVWMLFGVVKRIQGFGALARCYSKGFLTPEQLVLGVQWVLRAGLEGCRRVWLLLKGFGCWFSASSGFWMWLGGFRRVMNAGSVVLEGFRMPTIGSGV